MRKESEPVVGLRRGIPVPVGTFEILEDDPRLPVLFRRVTPDVKAAL